MSKIEFIARHRLIIETLRKRPASFEEIQQKLEIESEIDERNYNISLRTFQRDLKEIFSLYGLTILFNRKKGYYFIENEENTEARERLLEAFDIVNMLNITNNVGNYLIFEQRKPQGTENMHILLKCIQERKLTEFTYTKFWSDNPSKRVVEPYALREAKSRWYLVAKDLKDNTVKTFALDRLTEPAIKNKTFVYPKDEILIKKFKYCFGVITPDEGEPDTIILSFTPFQAKYIKTMPLHSSQKVVEETDKKCIVELTLFPTHDLIMEILSFGSEVKVLSPKSLAKEVVKAHKKALGRYK
jgi:predicted DNA-binding transcriptional regulator YafY